MKLDITAASVRVESAHKRDSMGKDDRPGLPIGEPVTRKRERQVQAAIRASMDPWFYLWAMPLAKRRLCVIINPTGSSAIYVTKCAIIPRPFERNGTTSKAYRRTSIFAPV
jgi:hypothetical protein